MEAFATAFSKSYEDGMAALAAFAAERDSMGRSKLEALQRSCARMQEVLNEEKEEEEGRGRRKKRR